MACMSRMYSSPLFVPQHKLSPNWQIAGKNKEANDIGHNNIENLPAKAASASMMAHRGLDRCLDTPLRCSVLGHCPSLSCKSEHMTFLETHAQCDCWFGPFGMPVCMLIIQQSTYCKLFSECNRKPEPNAFKYCHADNGTSFLWPLALNRIC